METATGLAEHWDQAYGHGDAVPVSRFSAARLGAALGDRWQMIDEIRELHTTPSGVTQPFTWAAFRHEL